MSDVETAVAGGTIRFAASGEEAEVVDRAVEVIGDQQEAMRWLGTPVRALGYATPISLVHDANGCEAVLAVLGRLEHGVL